MELLLMNKERILTAFADQVVRAPDRVNLVNLPKNKGDISSCTLPHTSRSKNFPME